MTIRYQCTECESVLKIRDDKAGQEGHCPKCKTAFVIPEPEVNRPPPSPPPAPSPPPSPPPAPSTGVGTGDTEDDAMAFLMESGDVVAALPQATTALDGEEELSPAIPPAPISPEERQLHRPPERVQSESDDTSSAASELLARSESARAATAGQEPVDTSPRINMDEVREVATRQVLPIAGAILVVAGLCYLGYTMMAGDSKIPPLASVRGTITLDGKPLEQATVIFQPIVKETDAAQNRLGGSVGRSDSDGLYTLTYTGGHDGAVLGTHRVRVNKTDKNGLEILAKKYHLMSQMKHEVKVGSNTIDLALESEPGGPAPITDPLANPNLTTPQPP